MILLQSQKQRQKQHYYLKKKISTLYRAHLHGIMPFLDKSIKFTFCFREIRYFKKSTQYILFAYERITIEEFLGSRQIISM